MSSLTLYIGSKNLSSWSLRPWLLLRHHGVRFKEVLIDLYRPDTRARILEHSPSGRVPALLHGTTRVWDSLAICEYAAETFALPAAWPMDPAARAYARSIAAEMHSGFADLRRELSFDATREPAPVAASAAAQADIERIGTIWREARDRFGGQGDWLCGHFGIADAMFAPVALRFAGYAVKLGKVERAYVEHVLAHPAVQQWIEAAAMEAPPPAPPAGPLVAKAADAPAAALKTAERQPTAAKPANANPAKEDEIGDDELPPVPSRSAAKGSIGDGRKGQESGPGAPARVRSVILPPD
ncbi:glutathione S-transferase family protein [Fontimonas sp. SYSU GA230001]|uniref:glutathione S-transferase family protein n=1 Tax=Fontimonas sp. SYSU GA230001 TaxID=3142450 RepID=UPI0032B3373D